MKIFFSVDIFSIPDNSACFGQKDKKKYIIIWNGNGSIRECLFPGAMILIDKKNTDVVTDSKGLYKVKVKPTSKKITVFSFTGGTNEDGN